MQALQQFAQAVVNKLSDIADYIVGEFQDYGMDISFLSEFFGSKRREMDQDPFDMLRQTLSLGKRNGAEDPLDALYPRSEAAAVAAMPVDAVTVGSATTVNGITDLGFGNLNSAAPVSAAAVSNNPFATVQTAPQLSAKPVVNNVIYLDRVAMGRALSQALTQGGVPLPQAQLEPYFFQQQATGTYGPTYSQELDAYQAAALAYASPWVVNGKRPNFGARPHQAVAPAPTVHYGYQAPQAGQWVETPGLQSPPVMSNQPHRLNVTSPVPDWYANPRPAMPHLQTSVNGATDPESVKIILDSYQSLSKSMDSLLNRYFTVGAV